MSPTTPWQELSNLAIWLGTTVSLLAHSAVAVFVVVVVRRYRPDAYRGLLAWAIFIPGMTIFERVFSAVVIPMAAADSSLDKFLALEDFANCLSTVVEVALLARGLLALARPPTPVPLPKTPLYR